MRSGNKTYPLSQTELGIVLACQNPTTAYNLPFLLELPAEVEEERLLAALQRFFALHPNLNSRLVMQDDGSIGKVFLEEELKVSRLNPASLSDLPPARPYDLFAEAPYRLAIVETEGKKYLFFEFHHSVFDGTSLKLFLEQLVALYEGETVPAETFSAGELAEKEAEQRTTEAYRTAESWTRDRFSGIENDPLPLVDFRKDSVSHARIVTRLSLESSRVAAYVREKGVRTSAFFLGAFSWLLAKMNGEKEALLSTIYNGRTKENAATVGMFVKTLPFCASFADRETVAGYLKKVSDSLDDLKKNDLYSFADASRDLGVKSELMFAYQGDYMFEADWKGRKIRLINLEIPEGKGTMSVELHRDREAFELWFEYRSDLYKPETVEQIIALYDRTLHEFLIKETLDEVDLLDEKQLALLEEANRTDLSCLDPEHTVLDYFAENVKKWPDHPLVVFREKQYSYAEADRITDRIAAALKAFGVGREKVVSVLIPKCEYTMLASLGVLKAGAAYQPLDPSYPPERLSFMVEDAAASALILDRALEGLLPDYKGPRLYLDEIETLPEAEAPAERPRPEDLFIMLYTSGTTGKPKGVMLEHGSILSFCLVNNRLYEEDHSSRMSAYASYGFDADMMDLYPALVCGGTVYIIPEEMRLDLLALGDYFNGNGITHSIITTQVGRQFVEAVELKTLKHFFVGGEKLVPIDPPKGFVFHNAYGPTEGTVFCCEQPLAERYLSVPIGKHLPDYKFYILDEAGRRLPWGIRGELYISGPQLARGYLNRPEENKKAFLKNPFDTEAPFERLYKTGDVVRFLKDGTVDFVGRSDGQVKIRGFRVELSEVEQIVREFPGVKDATVKDFTDPAGVKFIAAYVVSDEKLDLEALRSFIGASKPPYMIPASLMQIDSIPLNQNQKVNKRALPAPRPREAEIVPPENEAEETVYGLLSAILGHSAFGVTTDIYEAGLTSVSAIRFTVQLSKAFGKPFKNSDLAANPTVRALAALAGAEEEKREYEKRTAYPLTRTQEGIFVECMAKPGSTVYNIPFLFRLDSRIELPRLKKAVEATLRAHPYVMSRLAMNEEGDVVVLREDNEPRVDLISQEKLYREGLIRPFTLLGEKLYRAEIYRCRDENYLFLDFHHIFCDGTSEMILLRDISAAYEGQTPEQETYSGYEIALEEQADRATKRLEEAKAYYDSFLKGEETEYLPKKDLKTGPAELRIREEVPALSFSRLRSFASQHGLSLNAVFNFVFGLTLSKFVYKDRVLFTTVYNGRSDSRTVSSVSMMVKTLPVLVQYQEDSVITERIAALRRQLEGSQQNDLFSFAEIAQAYGVTADILFIYHGGSFKLEKIGGYPVESVVLASDTPKSPFVMNVFTEGDRFRFRFEYDGSLYNEDSIAAISRCFVTVMEQLGKVERIKDLTYLSETDRALYEKFNDTAQEIPPVSFNRLLEAQAERVPDKLAVIAQNGSYTYRELNEKANRLAHRLAADGIGPDCRVAVIMPRIREAYAAREGVLKSGAAFVPIDPKYPDDRVEYIIKESGAQAVVSVSKLISERTELVSRCEVPWLAAEELFAEGDTGNLDLAIDPSSLAYIIFTSGSTGKPKGVMIAHRNLVNLCLDGNNVATQYYRAAGDPVCYSFASLSFDASIQEECVPLSHGYTAVIASEEEIENPLLLAETLIRTKATLMFMTPSYAANVIDVEPVARAFRQLKSLLLAAESVSPELVGKLRAAGITAELYNGYGPTETTVGCTYHHITDEYVTIGRPVANDKIFILDAHGHVLPICAIGDLTIAGAGVGLGYMHLPDKTAEKYITVEGLPAYRSGDMARYNTEGNVEFFGRMDNQVKLRGLRVELDEIEKAITSYDGISAAVVIVKNAPEGDYLAGYFTAGTQIDKADLTNALSRSLTPYMVPKILMQLEKFPLTPNGKVDRRALPEPAPETEATQGKEPKTELEKKIAGLFARALGLKNVGTDQNFFDLGGTSLSVSKVAMLAVGAGLPIAYGDVFDAPTVEQLAAHVTAVSGSANAAAGSSRSEKTSSEEALRANRTENIGAVWAERPLGRVLLTGSTGFLGIHILRELLQQGVPVLALARSTKDLDALTRLKGMLMYYFDSPLDEETGRLVRVVDADVTDEALGEKLAGEPFDTIVNCAAIVKHFAADDIIERVNVGGVVNLIRLAKNSGARLIHISTISVAGENIDGKFPLTFRLHEDELDVGQDISNKYVNSKFKAEKAILEAVPHGLDAKIVRVGNLMGRQSDGEFQINSVTSGFIRDLRSYQAIGCFPVSGCDSRVDFSPIDEVARAILLLAGAPKQFTLFHAVNSHEVEMGDVIQAMNRCGFSIRIVPDEEFGRLLAAMMEDDSKNMLVSSLISYASSDKHVHQYIHTDNSFSVKALYRLGFKWPITDETYLTGMMQALDSLGFFSEDRT